MFSAVVFGDIFGPHISGLDATGSAKQDEGGHSDFLVWFCPLQLDLDDEIRFLFDAGGDSLPKGTPFRFAAEKNDEDAQPAFSDPPTESELRAYESRPACNPIEWLLDAEDGRRFVVAPTESRQHLSMHILWTEHEPERLRVSLSRKSIREILSRTGGEEIFRGHLSEGGRLCLTIGEKTDAAKSSSVPDSPL
jgi:hypothetical protein